MSVTDSSSRATSLRGRIAIDKKWKLLGRVSNSSPSPLPHKSRIYSSEVRTQQRHFPSPVLVPESFLRSKVFLACHGMRYDRNKKEVDKNRRAFYNTLQDKRHSHGVCTLAQLSTREEIWKNCFRKTY